MSSSPFLHLHKRKLTEEYDSERYDQKNRTLYKKEAWRFSYLILLCKLYDLSSFPLSPTRKAYAYTTFVMTFSALSFYRSSMQLADYLSELDEKYKGTYEKHLK